MRRKKRVQKQVPHGAVVSSAVKMAPMLSGDGGSTTYKAIITGASSGGVGNRINIHDASNGAGGAATTGIDVTPLGMHLKYEEIVADVTDIVEPSAIVIAKK